MIDSLRTKANAHRAQVSKEELLRYVECQFNVADLNRDGYLDVDDLQRFLELLSHPKIGKSDS